MKFEEMINKVINCDCYEMIKNIPDKSVDCIYVDIPYLYEKGGCSSSKMAKSIKKSNDNLIKANIVDGIDYKIFEEFIRILKNINCFVWCSKEQIYEILKWFNENTDCTYQILTWNKTNPTPMCNGNWLPDIEYCLYFNRGTKLNNGYELKSKWYISPKNKSDKEIAFGTIEEIANKLGIKKKSVLFYQTPTYAKRGTGKNKKLLIRVE